MLTSSAKSSVSASRASGMSFTKRRNKSEPIICTLETRPVRHVSIHSTTTSPRSKGFIFAKRNLHLVQIKVDLSTMLVTASSKIPYVFINASWRLTSIGHYLVNFSLLKTGAKNTPKVYLNRFACRPMAHSVRWIASSCVAIVRFSQSDTILTVETAII